MNAASISDGQAGGPYLPETRRVRIERPWTWLARGWSDLMAAPVLSLIYGGFFAVIGAIISYYAWTGGAYYLVFPLMAGFLLIGPLAAVGLYETSRRLESGQQPSLWASLTAFRSNPTQIAMFGVLLLVINVAWVRLAALIFMAAFSQDPPPIDPIGFLDHVVRVENLGFLIFGNLVGAALACVTVAVSVVSIPLLLDRPDANVFHAVVASWRAFDHNKATVIFWAAMIAVLMAIGFATAFIGLIVILPLIGYASWAAYKDIVIWKSS